MNILYFGIGILACFFGTKVYRWAKTTLKDVKQARMKHLIDKVYGEVKGQVDGYLKDKEEMFKGRR